jgi:hypothetical protein
VRVDADVDVDVLPVQQADPGDGRVDGAVELVVV